MGLRFRRSLRIAPGVRLNLNRRSVGLSAGVRGARYSINSDGRRTRSVGIPGTGLSYRTQSGGRRRSNGADERTMLSPTRLIASLVGWLTLLLFVIGIFNGYTHFAGTAAGVGLVAYLLLRVAKASLDPLLIWLLPRRASPNETDS
jgi:hypothetical protein